MMEMQRCRCGPKLPIGLEIELGEVWRKTQSRDADNSKKGC